MIDEGLAFKNNFPGRRESNTGRWIVFGVLVILSIILAYLFIAYPLSDSFFPLSMLILPMIVLLLYLAYRWASRTPLSSIGVYQDRRIIEGMKKHALRAEKVAGLEMYRCPDCQMSFELFNAPAVEDDIVLCPHCRVRLIIG